MVLDVCCLALARFLFLEHTRKAATRNAIRATAPTTIPAITPPESELYFDVADATTGAAVVDDSVAVAGVVADRAVDVAAAVVVAFCNTFVRSRHLERNHCKK